ncbi:cation transport ATPase [Legionella steigerwaltii]|uniref:Cation transport ATPase n=1 Tax=Legionella steigerwaltii TaxID=460 RepID=A0A378LBP8_9GAMM|nr:cation-translocating P-type ATPase [Legionella steigerwaltii]KTD78633.1 cation transport ATPase [Legionella steigerwaltii]STY24276.1 cation transport ATPase [Legionella steigerwaltii]
MPKSRSYIFYVNGMTCGGCSGTIKNYLKDQLSDKLIHFHADLTTPDPKKTTVIIKDEDKRADKEIWSEIKKHIDEIGFSCEEYQYQPDKKDEPQIQPAQTGTLNRIFNKTKKFFTSHWLLGALGCLSGVAVLILCLAGGLSLPFMISLAVFSTLLTLALGANSYYDAWIKLTKSKKLTMDSLFALSTASIIIFSIASLFVPWLPMMFEAGLLIYGFRHIGIAIEETIKEKIGTTKFQDRAPKFVRKRNSKGFDEISLELINEDDVIIVHQGEVIPLDGICENESIIYNTIITGATRPHYFPPQAKVVAGMRLPYNMPPLAIRVTKTQKESYLARLDAAIEASALDAAPIEIKTEELLTYFIPAVIALAVASGIIIGLFYPAAIAIQCAVSVLVSACPCTLGLITPFAVKTGMHKAAENGVTFNSAKTLQHAEQINTVIFDLNGTLTTGVSSVTELYLFDESGLSEADFLSYCSTLEKKSSHPIGQAIYSFANQYQTQNHEVTEFDDSHHSGVSGKIKNKKYTIGSMTLMKEKGISIPSGFKQPELEAGDQLVYVARDNTVIGFMVITDPLREDAYCTIQTLKAMGKEICLCTGADEETAHRYAKALGIEHVYAGCPPTAIVGNAQEENDKSKTAHILALRRKGRKVAMVGDAGNDTPAIKVSNLGIAVISDSSDVLTQEAAGAVIHKGMLLPIASVFAISKQTVSNINQNLTISLAYNLGSILVAGGLLVALGLTLNPVVGVTLMILQACMIFMNVYRFKEQPIEHLQEEAKRYEEASSPRESSHLKIRKHTPACSDELFYDQAPPTHFRPKQHNSVSYSFWSSCFSKESNEKELALFERDNNKTALDSSKNYIF